MERHPEEYNDHEHQAQSHNTAIGLGLAQFWYCRIGGLCIVCCSRRLEDATFHTSKRATATDVDKHGSNQRYAIDNYIFDPIFVAFLLIREKILNTEDIGIGYYSFTNLRSIPQHELQVLIDYIATELKLNSDDKISCKTQNGYEYQLSRNYLMIQGHELESKIMNKWPALNKIKRDNKQESVMKNFVLDMIVSEYPEFISMDFVSTFEKIV